MVTNSMETLAVKPGPAWLAKLRGLDSAYLLLAVCAAAATYPLFRSGFVQGHDLILEFTRVAEHTHLLRTGIFPVRWGADLEGGYGYPIYNFFPPLFMFIAGTFILVGGFSVVSAIKSAVFLLTLAGGIGMYWFARKHFEQKAGLLVACLYVLAPYHFIDLFNRNAFSEFTALAIAPFVLYGLSRIAKEDGFKLDTSVILTAAISFFLLSHNLSVAMYAPLFLVYFFAEISATGQWKKAGWLSLPLGLSFVLTAYYTLPLLSEIRFVQTWMLMVGKFDVLENLQSIGRITALITVLSWLLVITSIAALVIWRKNIPKPTYAVLCAFGGLLLLTIFMITPASRPLWAGVEFLKWLQFPWRLLSPATLLICFSAGALTYAPLPKNVLLYGGIALAASTLITFSLLNRGSNVAIPDHGLSPERIMADRLPTTALSEYLPIWVKDAPPWPVVQRLTPSRADVEVNQIEESPYRHTYRISAAGETSFTAHLFYFPGWKLYVNGSEIRPLISGQGLMQFQLPKGESVVELKFEDTPVRTTGNRLSILGLLVFSILLISAIGQTRRQRLMKERVLRPDKARRQTTVFPQ